MFIIQPVSNPENFPDSTVVTANGLQGKSSRIWRSFLQSIHLPSVSHGVVECILLKEEFIFYTHFDEIFRDLSAQQITFNEHMGPQFTQPSSKRSMGCSTRLLDADGQSLKSFERRSE